MNNPGAISLTCLKKNTNETNEDVGMAYPFRKEAIRRLVRRTSETNKAGRNSGKIGAVRCEPVFHYDEAQITTAIDESSVLQDVHSSKVKQDALSMISSLTQSEQPMELDKESDRGTSSGTSTLHEPPLKAEDLLCCLCEKWSSGELRACNGIAVLCFSPELVNSVKMKNFPIYLNKEIQHYYICLYHYRIIKNEPSLDKDEAWERRDFSKHRSTTSFTDDEWTAFWDDPLTKGLRSMYEARATEKHEEAKKRPKKKGKGDAGDSESDDEKERMYAALFPWMVNDGSIHKPLNLPAIIEKKSKPAEAKQATANLEVPFSVLPATTLRRYKKHFNLPHRSSTNTKQQLLEGIAEHFNSIPVDAEEVEQEFMHTVKYRKNKLDYPGGGVDIDRPLEDSSEL